MSIKLWQCLVYCDNVSSLAPVTLDRTIIGSHDLCENLRMQLDQPSISCMIWHLRSQIYDRSVPFVYVVRLRMASTGCRYSRAISRGRSQVMVRLGATRSRSCDYIGRQYLVSRSRISSSCFSDFVERKRCRWYIGAIYYSNLDKIANRQKEREELRKSDG